MCTLKKTQQNGLLGQLQSQLQVSSVAVHGNDNHNLPESWKWENQMNIKARRERKGKSMKKTITKKVVKTQTAKVVAAAAASK